MTPNAINYFRCPKCGGEDLSTSNGMELGEELNSEIQCSNCGSKWPIKNRVPRFVSEDNYASSFGYQWNVHRKTQLDSYTGFDVSRRRLFQVTGWPEKMEGQIILEAGSGAGRFTEILLGTGATVFSFDYSNAVEANWANNSHYSNLNLFQGDIFNIPIHEGVFDKVMCLGVIQHTPNPLKAFMSLAEQVRPGGEIVIDVYTKRLISLLRWKYILRPLTTRMDKELLYKIISIAVPVLLPLAVIFRKLGGRFGARLVPIVEYSYLGLPYELNKQWSILDTFDMYSPIHDHPQTIRTISKWFAIAGFENVQVGLGPNGVIAKGYRKKSNTVRPVQKARIEGCAV